VSNQGEQVLIDNPIINSPFREPNKQFAFDDYGIKNEIIDGRRPSSYFIPIAGAKKTKTGQMVIDTEWTKDRIEENRFINNVRRQVRVWRDAGYPGITPTTNQLLKYWNNPDREKKLFFCQIEALETLIYITEVSKSRDAWILNDLSEANQLSNPGLNRMAMKMATGSGKTVVMAMVIAWHILNKKAAPTDTRFGDAFLIVTPGITIRDRLRVLLPSEENNYYRERDLVPVHLYGELMQAQILITNFHAFQLRDKLKTGKLNKALLKTDGLETHDEMVKRVCRSLGNKKNLVVINDEAHHCYRRKPEEVEESAISVEEKSEVKSREEEAKIWISGLEAVKKKLGIRAIYDLSATPFFLKGSGYPEGTLFPWVVSDFSLIDAIESGIVKVPRVPISDDSSVSEKPTYRDLWLHIKDTLPKKGRRTEEAGEEPVLPVELQAALHSLYGNYQKYFDWWNTSPEAKAKNITAPVFIVVCNNTNVSKMVFDYIAGWEKEIGGQSFVQAGKLEAFRNDDGRGGWNKSPYTILVDSSQLESGEALSDDFKKVASKEIEEFKQEYSRRVGGKDASAISDSEILREVMNTVGKSGKLGENIRCVVSVSMLTEGWDANTVTHILGVRAFSTQLLCEQVVGRALRRRSYAQNEQGFFEPEYAEVYGVPFSFIPMSGSGVDVKPGNLPTRVRALEDRSHLRIEFPHILGYRYEFGADILKANFSEDSKLSISTLDVPTETESAPIVGEKSIHNLDDLRSHRLSEVQFTIAKEVLERFFKDEDGNNKPWLFPQILEITKLWFANYLELKDNTFPQLLLLTRLGRMASEKIYRSIVSSIDAATNLKPILRNFEVVGSTDYVDFDTTKEVMITDETKCHISHVVADTKSWEQKMAQVLESLPEVHSYVKNQNLGFSIPYVIEGDERQYIPDFIVRVKLNDGEYLNLVLEVSGEKRKDKAAKVETAKSLWVPAVNNHGGFGRWAFIEIADPWNSVKIIRDFLESLGAAERTLENVN
jgi:type III restriction enzyme